MPLRFPRKSDAWDGFRQAVAFPGEDEATGALVSCAIANAALTAHFGATPACMTSLLTCFRRHRTAIERAASTKYEAGTPHSVMLVVSDFDEEQVPGKARHAG
jgi:hypothetical protein